MGKQSSAFTSVKINDVAGTATDISTDVKSLKTPRGSDSVDLTTFGSGGTRAVTNTVQGAGNSNISMEVLLTTTTYNLACQLTGNNAGTLLEVRTGRNASPTFGDARFRGTYILVSTKFNIKPKEALTMVWEWRPAAVDNAVVPTWSRI